MSHDVLRVVSYNIHKGVQGVGPRRRLEIHNLRHVVETMDADLICLQEVRLGNRREERHFPHWPMQGQAEFLAPSGYHAVYRTNAITRHGEHGNALLSRWPIVAHQHEDMSDHRLEQRGLLHVQVDVGGRRVHVLVVHLGLIRASRVRQVRQLQDFIRREVPRGEPLIVAGDFNDWGSWVHQAFAGQSLQIGSAAAPATFPSRLPMVALDHVFARGLTPMGLRVPSGRDWSRLSDHLPLIAEFALPEPV